MLTPGDIEKKTFSTALRGYDLDEVDDFLDEIVATVRDLSDQLHEAQEAVRVREAMEPALAEPAVLPEPTPPEPAPEPDPAPQPEPSVIEVDESAIGRALLAAQNAADKLIEEAESEAARMVEDAKSEADSWTERREEKAKEAEAQIEAFATKVESIRTELAGLAGEVGLKLDDMDAVIAGETARNGQSADIEEDTGVGVPDEESGIDELAAGDFVDDDDSAFNSSDVDYGDASPDEPDLVGEALTSVANDIPLDAPEPSADFDVSAFEPDPSEEE